MQRNILIAYILTFLRNSLFWLGIWVFYYLKFTNYAGIGIIEAVLIIAITTSEIPTGAIADLLGKKVTLTISFLLQTIGMSMLAFLPHISWVICGAVIGGLGSSFYSGTLDALVYDSLKEKGIEKSFEKVISRITSISVIAPALCGILGGFLYVFSSNLPFIASAIFYAIGIPLTFFLIEPIVKEASKFSMQNFIRQSKQGFHELLRNSKSLEQTILLIIVGSISVICFEMLNDFLGVEFGFKPEGLALLWSFLYVVCAVVSYATPFIARFISYKSMVLIMGIAIALSLIISPFAGVAILIVGGISIGFRAIAQTLFNNASSILINEHVKSEYRTTTLSTFNLLKNIPYVLGAYFLGSLADKITSVRLAFLLGVTLLVFIALQAVFYGRKRIYAAVPVKI